jgi:23S rRNA (uracil1939-C5)-methyltransferase
MDKREEKGRRTGATAAGRNHFANMENRSKHEKGVAERKPAGSKTTAGQNNFSSAARRKGEESPKRQSGSTFGGVQRRKSEATGLRRDRPADSAEKGHASRPAANDQRRTSTEHRAGSEGPGKFRAEQNKTDKPVKDRGSFRGKAGTGRVNPASRKPGTDRSNFAASPNRANSGTRTDRGNSGTRLERTHSTRKNSPNPGRAASGFPVKSESAEDIRPGDGIVVTIKRLGINGEGVGYYKRKAVFVGGALPDEVVKATVTRVEPSYLAAELKEIEKPSPHRKKPECPVYAECGGCQLQHMSYKGQLRAKEELVREAFSRYTGINNLPLRPILGMDDPWGYRNKAQLQASTADGRLITGLYAAGSHRLVDISGCPIQHPEINRTVQAVTEILERLGIPAYDETTRQGIVRTVVARVAFASGDVQLTIITASEELPQKEHLVEAIRQELPQVKSIAQNVNAADTSIVFGDKTLHLWGKETLDEHLGDVCLSLSPRAFFQLNPAQTVKLYDAVKEAAALTGSELVVDAYCGTGTIGLWLAPLAREVRGIESVAEAVADAERNAQQSGAANAGFYAGRAEQLLPQWVREGVRPDVIVVDPPRTGCDRQLLEAIAEARPSRLVYVSCNPSTLAKDCKVLLDAGFRLEWVQPVDMFPQTAHVENCVLLSNK